MGEKKCFVVSPIGNKGSETRKRSDQVLNHIIRKVAEPFGYTVIRADEITAPGMISTDMFDHLLNDELVIADLTDYNPNVFYELAIRHATHKPVIQLIDHEQDIPFDIFDSRTIRFDYRDLDSVEEAKEEIKQQIEHVEIAGAAASFDNPLSNAIIQKQRLMSDNPEDRDLAKIVSMLTEMRREINNIKINEDKFVSKDILEVKGGKLRNLYAASEDNMLHIHQLRQTLQEMDDEGSDEKNFIRLQLEAMEERQRYIEKRIQDLKSDF